MPRLDAVASVGARLLENGHRVLLAVTGGRWPKRIAGMLALKISVVVCEPA